MTTATITSPRHQELINIMTRAGKPLTSKQLFAEAKGFERQDDVSKTLNYLLKKGAVERELYAQNAYSYWPATPANATDDSGNTLLRIGEDDPMPTTPTRPVRAVINDALKPCPEIDAVTREMADQAEIAYQVLSEVLALTPQQMCDVTLTDLAVTAAAMISLEKKGEPVAWRFELKAGEYSFLENKYATEKNVSLSPANHAIPLYAAPPELKSLCQANEGYRLHNEKLLQQQRDTELAAGGMAMLIDQIRHALDIGPASSGTDILAEIENISRLADRPAPPAAQNERAGQYIIISDPRGAAGTYETLDEARKFAESTARRSTFGRSAIVSVVAEVELVPQWSDA